MKLIRNSGDVYPEKLTPSVQYIMNLENPVQDSNWGQLENIDMTSSEGAILYRLGIWLITEDSCVIPGGPCYLFD